MVAKVAGDNDVAGDVTEEKLYVSVLNLSTSRVLLKGETTNHRSREGKHTDHPHLRVSFPGGWDAEEGDVLEAAATYRLGKGEELGYSAARSRWTVAAAPT